MKLEREYSQRRESSALKICGVDLRLVGLNGRDKFIHIVLSARHPLDRTRLVMTREGAQQGTHVCTDPIPCSAGAFRFADKTIAKIFSPSDCEIYLLDTISRTRPSPSSAWQ